MELVIFSQHATTTPVLESIDQNFFTLYAIRVRAHEFKPHPEYRDHFKKRGLSLSSKEQ